MGHPGQPSPHAERVGPVAAFRNNPAAAPPLAAGASIPRRDRVLIVSCIAFIAALAWVYLVLLSQRMPAAPGATTMPGMTMAPNAPWQTADALLTFAMWSVMMVGMMGTTAAPVLLVFAAAHARRNDRRVPALLLSFG